MFEKFKEYVQLQWPVWRSWLYRLVRGSFSAAIAQTLLLACGQLLQNFNVLACYLTLKDKWTDPKQAAIMLSVSFVSGFILAFGKAIRDTFGTDDQGNATMFSKVLPL